MRHCNVFLLHFLCFCLNFLPICGQDVAFYDTLQGDRLDWQEQILEQVDIDQLGDAAYAELLDELSDLVVWSDTTTSIFGPRLRQHIILSSNRCLNTRAGYQDQSTARQESNKAYLGDPWHHSIRYKMQYGKHWQAGANVEKDAGEAWRSSVPAFDSWHAYVRGRDIQIADHCMLQDAVVGHFRLRMGCGLLINQGFSLGKMYLSQQLLENRSNVIIPFASNTESNYMQGAAISMKVGEHLTLLPYFSARQIDGTLSEHDVLTALQNDGYHRTQTEERHRHAAWQVTSGARIGWRGEWYEAGIHATYTQLQYEYQRNVLYYNANYFRGHQLAQFAADYTLRMLGGILHGEVAIDDGGALANITALQHPIGNYWKASLLYRYYDNHYRQLHASALSESSGMQGEQGITLNADGQLPYDWQLVTMLDWFHFSQPQYGIRDNTSNGWEGSLRLSRNSLQLGHSAATVSVGYRIKRKGDYYRHTLDGLFSYPIISSLTLKTQLRGRIYNERDAASSYGYAASQAASWHCNRWKRVPFIVEGQACYFSTDDYDSRIYLTERPVLYGFGLPMLYGKGLRYSITSTIKIGRHVDIDLKWAMTNYANRSSISSGLQEIKSNTQQDIWLQLRIK